jgi:glucosyl-dolichyl phosphate glucuronosyltransferase
MKPPDTSVVVCTYNRAPLLRRSVRSVIAQRGEDLSYEIIVVDNNSSDDTQATVEALQNEANVRLRYFRELRQGNAYARNTGIAKAEGSTVAFLDDDCVVQEDWLANIRSAFEREPTVAFVGGRVLPAWEREPPSWLSAAHWAPLALLDYGAEERTVSGRDPIGLLSANLAVRRGVFQELGGFSPAVQRVKGGIGSMEDHELVVRMCRSGRWGLYIPGLIAWAAVGSERMTKAYHRRWHTGHGHFYSLLNDAEWERARFRLAGVPSHVYRETAKQAVAWCSSVLRGDIDAAFQSECRLRFFYGFVRQRQRRG